MRIGISLWRRVAWLQGRSSEITLSEHALGREDFAALISYKYVARVMVF
jgi:hypothetical protein